ncbi:hypothetical protein LCGC14_1676500, partial [marine sediment metagenome]
DWKRLDGDVDVFSDGFADGIYFDGQTITVDGGAVPTDPNLVDIMKAVDEVEIICALEGDQGIEQVRNNSTSQEKYLIRQKSLNLPDFKFEKRQFVLPNNYGSEETFRDDTTKMQKYLDAKLASTKDPVMSVSITTPILYYNLIPGDTIRKISGREIDINAQIVTVDLLLDPEQSCQISLSDERMRRFT